MADVPLRVRVRAPAKINLTLHVIGQRPDGYHLLDRWWSLPMWVTGWS
ncbi:hypothetical protein ACFQFQ_05035 [Sulfitobacter porphyrae]|uniref:4-(Cytidine 5'-diphospho)-2-C-methyl-D-erythritol kinase n=1 Tax=Sulfitobacter porphyrae TaxID=1246864 RepID=A0ABW2B0F5_9RHOB